MRLTEGVVLPLAPMPAILRPQTQFRIPNSEFRIPKINARAAPCHPVHFSRPYSRPFIIPKIRFPLLKIGARVLSSNSWEIMSTGTTVSTRGTRANTA